MIGKKIAGLPIWAIVLDALGTLMVVGGLLAMFGTWPAASRDTGLVLVIIGAFLMAPLIIAVVRRTTDRD